MGEWESEWVSECVREANSVDVVIFRYKGWGSRSKSSGTRRSFSLMRLVVTSLASKEVVKQPATRWTSAARRGKLKTFLSSLLRDSIASAIRFDNSFINYLDEIFRILRYS